MATERVNAGPGRCGIDAALGGRELPDDRTIWQRGIAREDEPRSGGGRPLCDSLGTVVGDYALAQGASAVVLAGGLGLRLRALLPHSAFGW